MNEFKKGYKLISNVVRDENGDLLALFHNVLNIWKKQFCLLLNVHRVIDLTETYIHTYIHTNIHTAELLIPDKTDNSCYRGISLLPTTYKILSSILFPIVTPCVHVDEMGDNRCEFRRSRSTTD